MGKKRRKGGLWWKVPALILVGLFGWTYLFGIGPVDVFPAARQADAAVAEYRKAGLPWEAQDLAPKVPDDENGARDFFAASSAMDEKRLQAITKNIDDSLLDGDLSTAGAALESVGPVLSLASQASEKPKLNFNRDWDQGASLLFPEFSRAKSFVKLLSFRARLEAVRGHPEQSLKDLERGWKLSELIGQEPTMIGMLVQIAGEAIVAKGAERCAQEWRGQPDHLLQLRAFLKQCTKTEPSFERALRGEAYMGLTTIRNTDGLADYYHLVKAMSGTGTESTEFPAPPKVIRRTGLPNGVISRAFATQHLRLWTKIAARSQAVGGDPHAIGEALDAASLGFEKDRKVSTLLEEILMPVFSQAGTAIIRRDAGLAAQIALTDALIFEAKTGAFPTKIGDLPEAPLDPFTKKPLLLKLQPNGIRIYSVGANLEDNGGVTRAEDTSGNEKLDDVVAAYPTIARPKRG